MQDQIDADIKAAMLGGDKPKAETLRGLKSAILNEAIASGAKDIGISDEQIQKVLSKEAKKRQEAADLYKQGGNNERAEAELAEKTIIEAYLPEQASEEDTKKAVDEEFAKLENPSQSDMSRIIGVVRGRLGAGADGAAIAKLVKEKLSS